MSSGKWLLAHPALRLLVVLLGLLLFSGCSSPATVDPEVSQTAREHSWSLGTTGGSIVLTVPNSPVAAVASRPLTHVDLLLMSMISSPLVRPSDSSSSYEGVLAESWELESRHRRHSLMIRLRAGLRWSDGAVMTAQDIAQGYAEHHGKSQVTATATSGTTLVFSSTDAPAVLFEAACKLVLPRSEDPTVVGGANSARSNSAASNPQPPAVSGPFVPEYNQAGDQLVRNWLYSVYDRGGTRLPYLDRIEVRAEGGATTLQRRDGDSQFIGLTMTTGQVALLARRGASSWFEDPDMLRWVRAGLDLEMLAEDTSSRSQVIVPDNTQQIIPIMFDPAAFDEPPPYEGSASSLRFRIVDADPLHRVMGQMIARNLEARGIAVDLDRRSSQANLLAGLYRSEWDLAIVNLTPVTAMPMDLYPGSDAGVSKTSPRSVVVALFDRTMQVLVDRSLGNGHAVVDGNRLATERLYLQPAQNLESITE